MFSAVLTGISWAITDSIVLISAVINTLIFLGIIFYENKCITSDLLKLKKYIKLSKHIDLPIFLLILWRIITYFVTTTNLLDIAKILWKNLKFFFDFLPFIIFRSRLWYEYYNIIFLSFIMSLFIITLLGFLETFNIIKLGFIKNADLLGFHRNHIKSGFIWGLGASISLIIGIKDKNNVLLYLIFPILTLGLFMTHGRTYYVGFLIVSVYIFILLSIKYSFRKYVRILVFTLITPVLFIITFESIRYRFSSIFTGIFTDTSIKCRLIFYKESISAFIKNPITGLGYSHWSEYFSSLNYNCPDYHVHNIYLHELAETGIIGAIILIYFIVFIIIKLTNEFFKVKKAHEEKLILIGLAAFLLFSIGGFFEPNFVKSVVLIPTFTLTGITFSILKSQK